jgi:hypothetical protein
MPPSSKPIAEPIRQVLHADLQQPAMHLLYKRKIMQINIVSIERRPVELYLKYFFSFSDSDLSSVLIFDLSTFVAHVSVLVSFDDSNARLSYEMFVFDRGDHTPRLPSDTKD